MKADSLVDSPEILKNAGTKDSIKTYKFYSKKGERLGIFLDKNKIVVIRCSLKDQFRKKTAKDLFQIYKLDQGYTPEVHTFDHDLNGKEFFDWCKNTYYIKTESKGECKITWLVNKAKTPNSTRIVLKSTPYKKMWQ